jgi:hypothetical protein
VGTATAATFSATNTATLLTAISDANATSGSNTITLAAGIYGPTSTVNLTNTSGTTTIEGPSTGVGTATLEPNFTTVQEVFISVAANAKVDLRNLVVSNGGGLGDPSIDDFGTLDVDDSALSGNNGAAVFVEAGATANITGSTIGADQDYGMIVDGTANLVNATVAFNTNGGIANQGTVNLTNSIVAENPGGDCSAPANTADHSLDSDGSCGVASPLSSVNPLLSNSFTFPVLDGGTTPTYPLQKGSPAIGAGDKSACEATDQRGFAFASPCDVGSEAYSSAAPTLDLPSPITVPATSDSGAAVPFAVSATSSDGTIKTLSCVLPSNAAVTSGATFPIATTTVTCTATDYHGHSTSGTFTVTVTSMNTLTPQTIMFTSTAPTGATVGGATYTPTATASSGLAVAITLDSSSTGCTLSSGTVSFTGTGICVIDANQAGNSTYSSAPMVQQSIVVSPAAKTAQSITVTSTAPTGATVGGATYTPAATASSGLAVAITLDASSAACTISGGVVSFTGTGTCVIDFNQSGNATYDAAAEKQQSIVVSPAAKTAQSITVTSTAPTGATVGGATYTPTATASSGLAVAITLDSSSSGCSLSSGAVSFTGTGTCVIDFNQAGNATYAAAPEKQQSVTVSKSPQAITVTSTAPASTTVGGATYTPAATASSGLAVSITLDASSSGCTLSGGVVSFTADGTCVIDFNQAGNGTYAAAAEKQQSIAVGKTAQSITVTSTAPTSPTVGGATYTPAATASSGLAVAITLDASSGGCSLSGGVVSFTGTGTCVIDFNQAGNATYGAAPEKQQSIAVSAAAKMAQSITVTSTAPAGATVGGATYTPTATASSGLGVAITLDASSAGCSLSGGVVSFTGTGSCVIDFNQSGNATYAAAAEKQQSIVVSAGAKTAQSITVTSTAPTGATVGGATYTPAATASSGLAVAITLDASSAGCSLSGGLVSFTGTGTCVIDFNQTGNGTYAAAAEKQQSIAVSAGAKTAQSITVTSTAPTGATVGGATYTPTATASSGLPVAITLDSSSAGCSLSGGVVSFTGTGTCVIDFNQAGNATYAAAAEKQQKVAVAASASVEIDDAPSSLVSYGGSGWTHGHTGCVNFDCTESFSLTAGNYVELSFTGTGVTWIAPKSNNGGYASVYLDGVLVASNVTTYAAATSYQQVIWSDSGLANGPHTLKIVVDGTKPSASINTYVQLDAFIVSAPAKENQSIAVTSNAPTDATAGGPTYKPAATASSGLPVAITLDSSSSGCTLSGGTVSFTGTGTCVIDFNQAGNATYAAAAEKQQKVAVAASASVEIDDAPSSLVSYGGSGWTHGHTGCVNFDCTESFSLTAGNYVELSFTGTGVTWIAPKSNNGGYASVYLDGVLVASNVTTYAAATSYQQVIWSDSGLANGPHTLKIVVDGTKPSASINTYVQLDAFIVSAPAKENQSIAVTSNAPTDATAGGPTYKPAATASSGLPVAITLDSSSSGCTLSGGVVSFIRVGTCVIDFIQAGKGSYNAAPEKQQRLTIAPCKTSSQHGADAAKRSESWRKW